MNFTKSIHIDQFTRVWPSLDQVRRPIYIFMICANPSRITIVYMHELENPSKVTILYLYDWY